MAMDLIAGRAAPPDMGPPPGAEAGPPPDLAGLLGMGGGGPEAPPGPTPGVDAPTGGSELEALDIILTGIDNYMAIPTVSEQEKLIMEKVSTMVQQLKAQNEKMSDQISGGSAAARKVFGGA
jgi:hypothetical protein